jgi:two-component system, OmpR family, KDP operon response regulator KdpE
MTKKSFKTLVSAKPKTRSTRAEASPFFQTGHLAIDFNAHIVTVNGDEVKLTATEYALLRVLALNAGKVVTHRHLLREGLGGLTRPNSHNTCACT